MSEGKLIKTDIYTGGLGRKINRIYDYNRFVVKYSNADIELANIPQKNIYEVEDENNFFKIPSLILAPSGMMIPQTISFRLGKKWLSRKDSAIFTVGYMEPKTPGYIFANAKRGSKIKLTEFDDPIDVNCSIKNFRFTAHSRREELLEIVYKLNPQNVILVHGDQTSINWIGASILKKNKNIKVFAAQNEREIILT